MKNLILSVVMLCTILLSACSINFGADNKNDRDNDTNQEKSNKKNNDQSNSKSDSHSNNETSSNANQNNSQEQINQEQPVNNTQNHTQISSEKALQNAKDVFSGGTYHSFKIDPNRSTESDYFITFLLNDAAGTPQSSATTVNKTTGEVGNYIDDRTEEEIKNYNQFIKESPKYKGSTKKLEELSKKDRTRPNDKVIKQNNNNVENNQSTSSTEESSENNQNQNDNNKDKTEDHQENHADEE